MKKLLITGFDPFGGEMVNPSWEAVRLLPAVVGGYELTKIQIPTVFGKAQRAEHAPEHHHRRTGNDDQSIAPIIKGLPSGKPFLTVVGNF